jgi:hypothetical protein
MLGKGAIPESFNGLSGIEVSHSFSATVPLTSGDALDIMIWGLVSFEGLSGISFPNGKARSGCVNDSPGILLISNMTGVGLSGELFNTLARLARQRAVQSMHGSSSSIDVSGIELFKGVLGYGSFNGLFGIELFGAFLGGRPGIELFNSVCGSSFRIGVPGIELFRGVLGCGSLNGMFGSAFFGGLFLGSFFNSWYGIELCDGVFAIKLFTASFRCGFIQRLILHGVARQHVRQRLHQRHVRCRVVQRHVGQRFFLRCVRHRVVQRPTFSLSGDGLFNSMLGSGSFKGFFNGLPSTELPNDVLNSSLLIGLSDIKSVNSMVRSGFFHGVPGIELFNGMFGSGFVNCLCGIDFFIGARGSSHFIDMPGIDRFWPTGSSS